MRGDTEQQQHSLAYSGIDAPDYAVLLQILNIPEKLLRVEHIVGPGEAAFDGKPASGPSIALKLSRLAPKYAVVADSMNKDEAAVEAYQWLSHAYSTQIHSFLTTHPEDMTILRQLHSHLADRVYVLAGAGKKWPTIVDVVWYAKLQPRLSALLVGTGKEVWRVLRWAKHLEALWGIQRVEIAKLVERLTIALAATHPAVATSTQHDKSEVSFKKRDKDIALSTKDESLSTKDPFEAVDLRVGLIRSVEKHLSADRLYVEQVDFGDPDKLRTVVSGLVEHVPEEQLEGKLAIFICNLKPASLCKVISEAMLLVGKQEDKLEILQAPSAARCKPGDRVSAEGIALSSTPPPTLKPKEPAWDVVKSKLVIKGGEAFYGERRLSINGYPISTTSVIDGVIS